MRPWIWLTCCALVLAPAASALASDDEVEPYSPQCSGEPTATQREAAKGAFAAGVGSYQEGDYPKAIMYWRDAYRRDCTAHALLQNLANAYERMGNRKATIYSLRTYLERVPDDKDRALLETRIKNLQRQLGEESRPVSDEPRHEEPPSVPDDSGSLGQEQGRKSITPWFVVGGGGLATIVGTVVLLGGNSKVNDATDACPSRENCDPAVTDKGNSGRTQMTVGGAVMGVGLAGVTAGLLWHFVLDKPKTGTESATGSYVAPAVQPGFAGLSVGGHF